MSFLHPRAGTGGTSDPAVAASGESGEDPSLAAAPPAETREPMAEPSQEAYATRERPPGNMLPGRERRRSGIERLLVRFIATGGVIGIGVALGAILASNKVHGWIIGLVVAAVSVILSAILWSSRQL